jgi:hypothetical protein
MRSLKLLATLSLILGLAPAVQANDSYVRYQQDQQGNGALQTGVAHFSHPDKKVEIILYGVVHIADADYYANVQRDLDSYDKVLFEGVAPGSEAPTEADKSLGEMQKMMGEMLGMTFQKDGIDYTRSNLRHADMNMDQLKEAMGGKSVNPMGGMMDPEQMKRMAPMMKMMSGMAKAFMQGNPAMQDRMRAMFAQQMTQADLSKVMDKQMANAILIERNKVVMDVLADELTKTTEGTIGIFYGAAHNPDFEERLNALGWQRTSKRWMSAWKVGQGVGPDEPALARTPKVPTVSTGKPASPGAAAMQGKGTPSQPKPATETVPPAKEEPRWF